MKMQHKTDHEDLIRDDTNHALINKNVAAYRSFIAQRESQRKIMSVEEEIESVKKDVMDIKEMLMILIKQTNKEK